MQFNLFSLVASALAVTSAFAQTPTVLNTDVRFDEPNGRLDATICSAESEGNLQGLETFGEIPSFPLIAGSFLITDFQDVRCGECYELSFTRDDGTVTALNFTIVNNAPAGFISGVDGLELLTGLTPSTNPGDVPISYKKLPSTSCGFGN